jgi:integrase
MATIAHDKKSGHRGIQFTGLDAKRRVVRLGKVTKKQAESAKGYIEDLLACKTTGSAPQPRTAEWIIGLPVVVRKRLARVRLLASCKSLIAPTLKEWLDDYSTSRHDVKESTSRVYGHTIRNLLTFFGDSKRLDEITQGDADNFGIYLKTQENLADNTVRRRLGMSKQFFRAAIRKKLISENPFEGQSTTVRENPRRFYFVSVAESQAVLEACPDAQWRLVFALCRFGGLRCPSEVARLKWEDINWEKSRFTVHASKTEHHADGGIRVVPIFPELGPHFMDAFERAETGAEYCCPQFTNASQMYRKHILKIIQHAGLTHWPKLFQNCRSSRETELAESYPIQVVCGWIGNSPKIAAKHYLQITEDHFEKAVQFPVQNRAVLTRTASQPKKRDEDKPFFCRTMQKETTPCENTKPSLLGVTGLEPVTSSL